MNERVELAVRRDDSTVFHLRVGVAASVNPDGPAVFTVTNATGRTVFKVPLEEP